MKKILILFLVLFIAACKSKNPSTTPTAEVESIEVKRFESLNLKDVVSYKKNRAYELGKRLMETCNTSKFKSFNSSEATESVIKNATIEKISSTCQKINMRNGKFLDLNLMEVMIDNQTNDLIFKYDIKYEKKYYQRELKITINNDNKVSSISTKEVTKKPM